MCNMGISMREFKPEGVFSGVVMAPPVLVLVHSSNAAKKRRCEKHGYGTS